MDEDLQETVAEVSELREDCETCAVDGCTQPAQAHYTWCAYHVAHPRCNWDGCAHEREVDTLCRAHFEQWLRNFQHLVDDPELQAIQRYCRHDQCREWALPSSRFCVAHHGEGHDPDTLAILRVKAAIDAEALRKGHPGIQECRHPGCTRLTNFFLTRMEDDQYSCELHQHYYHANYTHADALEYFRSAWKGIYQAVEGQRKEGHAEDLPEVGNAILITWRFTGEKWHDLHQHGPLALGDVDLAEEMLPNKKEPSRLLPWGAWGAKHMAEWLTWAPSPPSAPTYYVALYAKNGVLHTVASPGVPLVGGIVDVRVLSNTPDIWLQGSIGGARATYREPQAALLTTNSPLQIPCSPFLLTTHRALRRLDLWAPPDSGRPGYYEEGDTVVYFHPGDGYTRLTPEQEQATWAQVLALDEDQRRTFLIALAVCVAEHKGVFSSEKVRLHANTALGLMNKKKHKRAYDTDDKLKFVQDLATLNNMWITGPQIIHERGKKPHTKNVRSRLIEVAYETNRDLFGGENLYAALVALGDWAKPLLQSGMRETAFLLREVLQIESSKGKGAVASSVGIVLTLHWRIRASHRNYEQPWKVKSLLEAAGIKVPMRREEKRRLRENFEQGMDLLQERAIVADWEYTTCEEGTAMRSFEPWLQHSAVRIVPPAQVVDHYGSIASAAKHAITRKSIGARA